MTADFESLLIIKPSSLGDVVHALPILRGLRRRYPKARLAWLVHERWSELLRDDPDLDEVLSWSFRWRAVPELIRMLGSHRFDAAIDLQGLLRSGLIGLLSRAPVRVGFASGREGSPLCYTHRVAVPSGPIHAIDRYRLLGAWFGIPVVPFAGSLPVRPAELDAIDTLLKASGVGPGEPYAVIQPAARWETKRWPLERFARLADRIQASGIRVVVVGGPGDRQTLQRLVARMDHSPVRFVEEVGLKLLAALLKRSALVITNDSGPMHMAVAVGAPVLALFGPTDPVRTGPYSDDEAGVATHTVIRKPVSCSPCLSRRCRVGDHRCLEEIAVDEVFEAARRMLERK